MKRIIITESQLKEIIKENKHRYDVYHETFTSAVSAARSFAESQGYEINEDDWWSEITTGRGRPKEGKTTSASIGLFKNGKEHKKALQIQVYNLGNSHNKTYELNCYIF